MLLILGGLPGVGKTAIATALAREIDAVHLRIDSIARDNLNLGRTVIADSVNPVEITRSAWREVAQQTGNDYVEIEIICSDQTEHQQRVENRVPDIPGHQPPTWQQVLDREYEPWRAQILLDTAGRHIDACIAELRQRLKKP